MSPPRSAWVGGRFGGFVAALLAIPAARAFQVIVREAWRLTAPPAEADAEESDIIKAGGDATREARDIAQQGVVDDGGDAAQSGEPAGHGAHAARGPS